MQKKPSNGFIGAYIEASEFVPEYFEHLEAAIIIEVDIL